MRDKHRERNSNGWLNEDRGGTQKEGGETETDRESLGRERGGQEEQMMELVD